MRAGSRPTAAETVAALKASMGQVDFSKRRPLGQQQALGEEDAAAGSGAEPGERWYCHCNQGCGAQGVCQGVYDMQRRLLHSPAHELVLAGSVPRPVPCCGPMLVCRYSWCVPAEHAFARLLGWHMQACPAQSGPKSVSPSCDLALSQLTRSGAAPSSLRLAPPPDAYRSDDLPARPSTNRGWPSSALGPEDVSVSIGQKADIPAPTRMGSSAQVGGCGEG